jgi:hypothetical protein
MDKQFPVSVSIANDNREGITRVLFQADPNLLDSLARSFFDSHVELVNNLPTIKPNARMYKCETCQALFDRELITNYAICDGIQEKPHTRSITVPQDWKPPCTNSGFNALLGAVERDLSSTLATGNYGDRVANDVSSAKQKLKLEQELLSRAYHMACSELNMLVGNKDFMQPDIDLAQFFSYSFVYSYVMGMTSNIYAGLTKGKGLAAINALATNRVVYEEKQEHEMGYSNRRSPEQDAKNLFDKVFNTNHNI